MVEESSGSRALVDALLILARSDTAVPPRARGGRPSLRRRRRWPGWHCGAAGAVERTADGRVLVAAAHAEVDLVLDNLLRNAARYAYSAGSR